MCAAVTLPVEARLVGARLVVIVEVHVDLITDMLTTGVVVTPGGVIGVVMIENSGVGKVIEGSSRLVSEVLGSVNVTVDQSNSELVREGKTKPELFVEELREGVVAEYSVETELLDSLPDGKIPPGRIVMTDPSETVVTVKEMLPV